MNIAMPPNTSIVSPVEQCYVLPIPDSSTPDTFIPLELSPLDIAQNELDVLVVIAERVLTRYGKPEKELNEILSEMAYEIGLGNQAFENADIPLRFRIVGTEIVSDTLTSPIDQGISIASLINTSDGLWDSVHQTRNDVGADAVIMVDDLAGTCGVSRIQTYWNYGPEFAKEAFAIVDVDCLTEQADNIFIGHLVVPHELGHILGGLHQSTDSVYYKPIVPYMRGWADIPGTGNCTMMAVNCRRFPVWSHPQEWGTDEHNMVKAIKETAGHSINFRDTMLASDLLNTVIIENKDGTIISPQSLQGTTAISNSEITWRIPGVITTETTITTTGTIFEIAIPNEHESLVIKIQINHGWEHSIPVECKDSRCAVRFRRIYLPLVTKNTAQPVSTLSEKEIEYAIESTIKKINDPSLDIIYRIRLQEQLRYYYAQLGLPYYPQ